MNLSEGVADLHLHTTSSDGTSTVENRIQQAQDIGLESITITDHDTISEDLNRRVSIHKSLELIL
ncbi:PHP domain-containing protein, partial [Haloarcula sp. Atlit-7R]|uniref:PHP domain-containing protein n=2 Tax=Halobacteriales TaxID=2235 RepID=UPI000EF17171